MTSINLFPTFVYSQPSAYCFSHDSVFLARKVFENCAERISPQDKLLDLCAGCGIVGMDFLFHCRKTLGFTPAACDFVEIQSEYAAHFAENVKRFGETDCALNFLQINYSALLEASCQNKYDLVICNPPYFRLGQGKLSSSPFKNRCRFYLDSDFSTLLKVIVNALKPAGEAYVLVRDLCAHGIDPLSEARLVLAESTTQLESVADIRGTGVLRIYAQ